MRIAMVLVLCLPLLGMLSCKPDVGANPQGYNPKVVALFDPTQCVLPTPNDILKEQGKLTLPTECMLPDGTKVPLYSETMKEFVTLYLNTLDGFPIETQLTFDFYSPDGESVQVDPTTIPSHFRLFDVTSVLQKLSQSEKPTVQDLVEVTDVSFAQVLMDVKSPAGTPLKRMVVKVPSGLEPGHTYFAVLTKGIKAIDKNGQQTDVVSSFEFNFLKSKEPLVENSLKPGDETKVSRIPVSDADAMRLEQIRLGLKPVFDFLEDNKVVDRASIVLAWGFSTASAPQLVFDPEHGDIPTPNDLVLQQLASPEALAGILPQGVDCSKPETIDTIPEQRQAFSAFVCYIASLKGFSATSLGQMKFSTTVATESAASGVKIFDITTGFQEVTSIQVIPNGKKIYLLPLTPFEAGHRYLVALLKALKGENNQEARPSPAMAMLLLVNPLVDKEGKSTLPDLLTDEQAKMLEDVRLAYKPLLDGLANAQIRREDLVGFFTFTITPKNEALFDPTARVIPFPNEILFVDPNHPSKGINLPIPESASDALRMILEGLSGLDGFSTLGSITTSFSMPLEQSSLVLARDTEFANISDLMTRLPQMLKDISIAVADITDIAKVNEDGTTELDFANIYKLKIVGENLLQPVALSKTLTLKPKLALESGRRYMVVIFDSVKAQGQNVENTVSPTFFLARMKYKIADCDEHIKTRCEIRENYMSDFLSDSEAAQLEYLRQQYNVIFGAMEMLQIPRESIVLFFTFRTLSVASVLEEKIQSVQGIPSIVGNFLPYTDDKVITFFGGSVPAEVGYVCLDCKAKITTFLAPPDLTDPQNPKPPRFGNAPEDREVPFIFILPNGTTPFPVVFFAHGIHGDKTRVKSIVPDLTRAGFAIIAPDLPLHGDHPIRVLGASSGTLFFNVDVFSVTENFLEAVIEQAQFAKIVNALDDMLKQEFGVSDPVLDTMKQFYLGVSLGGIIGAISASMVPDFAKLALVTPGGHLMRIFEETANEDFRKPLVDALSSLGIEIGSPEYQQFIEFAQWGLDRADPVNFARGVSKEGWQTKDRIFIVKAKGDDFIPNSTTDELVATMALSDGTSPKLVEYSADGSDLCHAFFMDGCSPEEYPRMDQTAVQEAQEDARADVINFFQTN